ncbi:MAG TPA: sel1 repeat family protein [Thermoanaerobaculia bacterium]|nr:sel1 repeat family protein [Thermoanaerobaculia bacterium]
MAACDDAPSPAETVAQVTHRVSVAAWRGEVDKCPSALMREEQDLTFLKGSGGCKAPEMQQCLALCDGGNAAACYWLAISLQEHDAPDGTVTALFRRACRLGIVSGCTNSAAAMLLPDQVSESVQQCASATFAKACALDDPWGCTMYAAQLAQGAGVAKDTKLALKVLEKSCKYGADDPACIRAGELRAKLQGK